LLEGRLLLSAGDLDSSFGTGGYVLANSPAVSVKKPTAPSDGAEAVAIQVDGKILAAGWSANRGTMEVVRLNPDGRLDDGSSSDTNPADSFGSGGRVLSQDQGRANAMAVDSAGRIVLVGSFKVVVTVSRNQTQTRDGVGLLRLLADGKPDPTFGQAGKVATLVGSSWAVGNAVAIQSDGKIVVVGEVTSSSDPLSHRDGLLLRYNADGSLDDGSPNDSTHGDRFGTGGVVVTSWAPGLTVGEGIFDVAIQDAGARADGKIVVSGSITPEAGSNRLRRYLARYNADGSLDDGSSNDLTPSDRFGPDGHVVLPVSPTGPGSARQPIVIQPNDGAIVWAGTDYNGIDNDLTMVRYTASGEPDPTFGSGTGLVTVPRVGTQFPWGVTMQPDGRLVVVGASTSDSFVARFEPNGSLDSTSFRDGGFAVYSFTSGVPADRLLDVAVQADGRIVAVGQASPNGDGNSAFLIARFMGGSGSSPAAASPSVPSSPTAISPLDQAIFSPLATSTDLDLTQLATEWLRSSPKRSRPALRSSLGLGTP
jgi:uncharacterized delta-60 repeat protein